MTVADRIERNSQPIPWSGCHVWTAYVNEGGYGRMSVGGHARFAHRIAYELVAGPIPEGLVIDHLCRMRCCVNPAHMEPVTRTENQHRGDMSHSGRWNAAKTHCRAGHPYDGLNLVQLVVSGRSGKPVSARRCRTCRDAAQQRWSAKQ